MNQQTPFDPEGEVAEEVTDIKYDRWRDLAIRFRQDGRVDANPSQIESAINALHKALEFAGERGMSQGEIEKFFVEDVGLRLTPTQVNTLIDIMAFDFGLVYDDGGDKIFLDVIDEAFGHVVKSPEGHVGIEDEGPGGKTTYDEDAKEGFWSAPEVFSEAKKKGPSKKAAKGWVKGTKTFKQKVNKAKKIPGIDNPEGFAASTEHKATGKWPKHGKKNESVLQQFIMNVLAEQMKDK
jgi:hypothetical protein